MFSKTYPIKQMYSLYSIKYPILGIRFFQMLKFQVIFLITLEKKNILCINLASFTF